MDKYKYMHEYTDETTIETLELHGALSRRTAHVLMREGHFNKIGDIKNLKVEEMLRMRNAGRTCACEIEDFISAYNIALFNRPCEMPVKRMIPVEDLLDYCRKCAVTAQSMADKIIENIGFGESEISALGGRAYFLQQARMYQFDIPNVIEEFIKERGI